MLDWLKTILGETYSEEIDKKVSEEIGKNFVARSDFNAKAEEVKTLSAQIGERDKQLKTLSESAENNEELLGQIKKLQEDNKAAKKAFDEQVGELRFNAALDDALLKAGALDGELVKVKLDRGKLALSDDGQVDGLDEQLKTAKENYGFLFQNNNTTVTGARPADGEAPQETDPFLEGFGE